VRLNADTQLGAFGPGADPTRRRAAIPPPCFLGGFEATEKIFKNQLKIDQQINEHRSNIDQK